MITKEKIIDDLKKIYQKLNKIPTRIEYIENTSYSEGTILRRFGTWNNALLAAFNQVNHIRKGSVNVKCDFCGKDIKRAISGFSRSTTNRAFCNHSCSAFYNNKIRKKSRRSKVEIMLFNLIVEKFPDLEILPNDKTMLDGLEVDIAIPSLKLAIEWNGIVHFKPIYGAEKLKRVQEIDKTKTTLACDKNINLIVISDLASPKNYVYQVFDEVSKLIENLI